VKRVEFPNIIVIDSRTPSAPNQEVTRLLRAWGQGDLSAFDELIPIVHAELRRLARRQLGREGVGHILQPTALVHEAYLRLVDIREIPWENRGHFFAMAARSMRRILVDFARARQTDKRGAGAEMVTLDAAMLVGHERGNDVVALDDALQALSAIDPRKAQIVELRFFGGLNIDETADTLNISPATVVRDWRLARVWLLRELKRTD
jgi:RNA polymerase sigma factor (TIGR02999 family)